MKPFVPNIIACAILLTLISSSMVFFTPGTQEIAPVAFSTRAINFEPYLQNVSTTSATVCFFTNVSETGTVYYSTDLSFSSSATDTVSSTFHEIRITGLSPGTIYNYYAKTSSEQSNNSLFKTASTGWDAFRFAAIGDTRTNHAEHEKLMGILDGYGPEFCLNAGDQVETGGSLTDWNKFFNIVAKYSNDSCYWPSIGNHDLNGDGGANYLKFFSLPNNERWYSFDYRNCHFVVLDTYSAYANGSAQNNWLRADLSAADGWAEWIFVNFHNPPYSSGASHGSDLTVRNTLDPIFVQYNVSVVFTGHDHIYEHADPGNGIQYFVTGGGGAPLTSVGTSWFTVKSASIYQFMIIDVNDNVTTLRCIKDDNTVFETIVLSHPDTRAPAAVPLEATDTGKGGEVFLNWSGYDEAGQGAVSYALVYSTSNFSDVSAMSPNKTFSAGNFTTYIRGLTNGTKYYFAVTAKDGSGNNQTAVDTVWAIPSDITPPAMPSGLAVVGVTNSSINLTWNANAEPDLAGYRVYMNASGTGVGGPMSIISTLGLATNLNVTNLTANTTYAFALDAIDLAIPAPNNSTRTANVTGKTDATGAPPPLVNHAPEVSALLPDIIIDEDPAIPAFLNLSSLFFDPDNDSLTFGCFDAPYLTVNLSANGTGLQLMPETNWNGATWVLVYADDSEFNVSANISVLVNPVNDPPIITTLDVTTSVEDMPYSQEYNATDVDNSVLTWVLITDAPWLGMNEVPGTISGTPLNLHANRTYWVNVSVSDGDGGEACQNFTLYVSNVNDLPQIIDLVSPTEGAVYEFNQSIEFKADVFDEDLVFGDSLEFNWTSNISGILFQAQNGSLVLPSGRHMINFTVTDESAAFAKRSINITVLPMPVKVHRIEITAPASGSNYEIQQQFVVSGTSENFTWGTSVEVVIGGVKNTTYIGTDGTWSIAIRAPSEPGTYVLTASAGEAGDNITIMASRPTPTKEDPDGTIFSSGLFIAGIITLVIIVILIIVLILVVMNKRKKMQESPQAGQAPETAALPVVEEGQDISTTAPEKKDDAGSAAEAATKEVAPQVTTDNIQKQAIPEGQAEMMTNPTTAQPEGTHTDSEGDGPKKDLPSDDELPEGGGLPENNEAKVVKK